MKFTILSHAAMCVEHEGKSVVTDPWLIGSCYWRSWWNFPEPGMELLTSFKADYVYLTHLHWDHYHGPSLRKFFSKETTFLVPKVCTRRMGDDLRRMGFTKIVEIPHGTEYRLGSDFTLRSYQFGPCVDSVAVFKGGGTCILDANDCKVFGMPLRHLLRLCGKPDFVLRSHSSASPLPYCVDGYEKDFGDVRTQQDYMEEFARFAIFIGAKYAIPFASNHCFLHKDTLRFNATGVTPKDTEGYTNRLAREVGADTRCVVMAPGSRWSDKEGFQLVDFDYSRRDEYVRALAEKHAPTLQKYYEEEEQELADFAAFRKYFEGFLKAIPWFIRYRWRAPLMFRVRDARKTHRWLVEPSARNVREVEEDVAGVAILDVPPRVINDCCTLKMFSVWTPSKRLQIHLPAPEALGGVSLLFLLLDAYELDNLPLLRNSRFRSLSVIARRWREGIEALKLIIKHKILRRPFEHRELYPIPGAAANHQPTRPEPLIISTTIGSAPMPLPSRPQASAADRFEIEPTWVTVAKVAELPPGKGKQVSAEHHVLALFNVDGEFHALADSCTHRHASLSSGALDGAEVTCPRHGARFDVRTGEPLCPPATSPAACYPVRVEGDEVQVELPVRKPQLELDAAAR